MQTATFRRVMLRHLIGPLTLAVWAGAVCAGLFWPAGRAWLADHPGGLVLLSFIVLSAFGMSLGLTDGPSGLALGMVVAVAIGIFVHASAASLAAIAWLLGICGWVVAWSSCVVVVISVFLAMACGILAARLLGDVGQA